MPRQSPRQKEVVGRVMHEFKHGELESGAGGKVKNPRQAIAIGLSEAGASSQQSPKGNKRNLNRTQKKEARGETAQARKESPGDARHGEARRTDLYRQAQSAGIPGRSKMSKDELQRALARH